ncbi:MAG: hypothetical protein U0904_10050 [Candidatus Nanopelagicales bacterium]|nr:hypothetical protein [Candidatus Nanopelagicales bacterium]
MSVLADRLLAIHDALAAGSVPHAFGGAIALAYCTGEPRATQDLDINIFVDHSAADAALASFPREVVITDQNRQQIADSAQARLWWDDTPVDVFFSSHEFYRQVAATTRQVPFSGTSIPVLSCTALAVFKAFFNRTKDWADLEAMAAVGQLDVVAVRAILAHLIGEPDPRLERIDGLPTHGDHEQTPPLPK